MQTRPMPAVVTGTRGQTSFAELQKGTVEPNTDIIVSAPAKQGEVVYHSHAKNLMVQITSPQDTFDPASGRYVRRDGKVAKFQDGEYRTSDPEAIEILNSNPRCGVNKLYWRAEELQAAVQQAKDQEFREFVMRNPEKVSAILRDLGAGVKEFPKAAVTPIPVPAAE